MFFDEETNYRMVAPDVDFLLMFFDRMNTNPVKSTDRLKDAAYLIFDILKPLAPLKNEEVKSIWIRIPRGTIEDYGSFEDVKQYADIDSYEDFERLWKEEYPEETSWYELTAVESFDKDGRLRFYSILIGRNIVISAAVEDRVFYGESGLYTEDAAVKLCSLILPAVRESVDLLLSGEYNAVVSRDLPYQFRTGVISRFDLWQACPDIRTDDYDGLDEQDVKKFREMIASGVNDEYKIGRIYSFTANDFFMACKAGYEAIGKNCSGYTLPELYMTYSDGRDEGLTGKGHGLNEGPGIDPDDPAAWDEWYFHRQQHGGHPWEVVPGGNSTHMSLYVQNDRVNAEWDFERGLISEEEYKERTAHPGYYFVVAGDHRQFETVLFYLALSKAGFPVVVEGASVLLSRFDGTDYVGIVPRDCPTRYCGGLFPDKYGDIVDFMHVYSEDMECYGSKIEWLPVEERRCLKD